MVEQREIHTCNKNCIQLMKVHVHPKCACARAILCLTFRLCALVLNCTRFCAEQCKSRNHMQIQSQSLICTSNTTCIPNISTIHNVDFPLFPLDETSPIPTLVTTKAKRPIYIRNNLQKLTFMNMHFFTTKNSNQQQAKQSNEKTKVFSKKWRGREGDPACWAGLLLQLLLGWGCVCKVWKKWSNHCLVVSCLIQSNISHLCVVACESVGTNQLKVGLLETRRHDH